MSEERKIICLCPYCKKHILMKFQIGYLGINIKECKTLQKKTKELEDE